MLSFRTRQVDDNTKTLPLGKSRRGKNNRHLDQILLEEVMKLRFLLPLFLLSVACKPRTMNDSTTKGDDGQSNTVTVKVFQKDKEEPFMWSGTMVLAGGVQGSCRIVRGDSTTRNQAQNSKLIFVGCSHGDDGTQTELNVVVDPSMMSSFGTYEAKGPGFAQPARCSYSGANNPLLKCTIVENNVRQTEDISLSKNGSGNYEASIVTMSSGKSLRVPCTLSAFSQSDVQDFLRCTVDDTRALEFKKIGDVFVGRQRLDQTSRAITCKAVSGQTSLRCFEY